MKIRNCFVRLHSCHQLDRTEDIRTIEQRYPLDTSYNILVSVSNIHFSHCWMKWIRIQCNEPQFQFASLSCIDCVIIDPELYKIMNIISGCVSRSSVVKINDQSNRTDWSRRTKWHLVCIIGSRASCHWHSHLVKCYLTCSHLVTALIRPGDVPSCLTISCPSSSTKIHF